MALEAARAKRAAEKTFIVVRSQDKICFMTNISEGRDLRSEKIAKEIDVSGE